MSNNKKPNILLIFSDQQHWEALGFKDPSFTTPNLDKFAEAATEFTHAFCTTPQCGPSRSSIFTGLYPSKTGVIGNLDKAGGQPLQMETFGPLLQRAGYTTGYFGKWHLGEDPAATSGWDEDVGVSVPWAAKDPITTERSIEFLKKHAADEKPFALVVSINDPHDIYHFPRLEDPAPNTTVPDPPTWEGKDFSSVPDIHRQFMEENQGSRIRDDNGKEMWHHYRKVYRAKTKLCDDWFGKVIDTLDELGLRDDTLIIFTSDHGDMDGQHRLILKGPFMYEHMVRVPLIIQPPKNMASLPAGMSTAFPTVNVDLAPTIADYAGATIGKTDGISLKPLLSSDSTPEEREFVVGQYYSKQEWVNPIRSIRTKSFKYNRYLPQGEELYDLETDPHELNNLADHPDFAATKAELRKKLDQWMTDNDDPFESQQATRPDGSPL